MQSISASSISWWSRFRVASSYIQGIVVVSNLERADVSHKSEGAGYVSSLSRWFTKSSRQAGVFFTSLRSWFIPPKQIQYTYFEQSASISFSSVPSGYSGRWISQGDLGPGKVLDTFVASGLYPCGSTIYATKKGLTPSLFLCSLRFRNQEPARTSERLWRTGTGRHIA